MMAAHVEESAKFAVTSSNHNERRTSYIAGNVLAWFLNLIRSANNLPRSSENSIPFQLRQIPVEIP